MKKSGPPALESSSYHTRPPLRTAQVTRACKLVLAVWLGCLAGWVAAQTQPHSTGPGDHVQATRPKVALVLSGGGARGFAHVGVLKALEAAHVPVDMVVGTSMGAIIGGLYASGMSPSQLERELINIEWGGLFESRAPRQTLSQRRKEDDLHLSPVLMLGFRDGEFRLPSGAISTRSLEWLLRKYTLHTRHLAHFDALPTPFRAVATDMETGQAVVLGRGDLAAALRASMSVPGAFSPLELDGRILGDGGLVDNLPVSVARHMGADVVIAVNIGTPLARRESLTNVVGVTAQMINILTEQNVQRSLAELTPNDLLLAPPLDTYTSASFEQAQAIAQLGSAYANTVAASLERFSVGEKAYAQWRAARQTETPQPPPALAFVGFEGVPPERQAQLQRLVDTTPNQALDLDRLENDLLMLSASGDYARVDYKLKPAEAAQGEGLVFVLDENDWGPNYFRVGLALNTDFQGEGHFGVRISHNRHWLTRSGTEWRNEVELGDTTAGSTELYHPWGGERDRFVAARLSAGKSKQTLFDTRGDALAVLGKRHFTLGLDHGWTMGRAGRLGEWRLGVFASRRNIEVELSPNPSLRNASAHWTETGLQLGMVSDQLDHANFPQEGYRWQARVASGHRTADGQRRAYNQTEAGVTHAFTWGTHTLNLHARGARVGDRVMGVLDEYALGGFHNLSGHKPGQWVGNHMAFARLNYYRRLPAEPVISRALFAGATLEVGKVWDRGTAFQNTPTLSGMSVYVGADTLVGPVYFGLVHAPQQSTGIYLLVGRP